MELTPEERKETNEMSTEEFAIQMAKIFMGIVFVVIFIFSMYHIHAVLKGINAHIVQLINK